MFKRIFLAADVGGAKVNQVICLNSSLSVCAVDRLSCRNGGMGLF
jgi:hypothetical protein